MTTSTQGQMKFYLGSPVRQLSVKLTEGFRLPKKNRPKPKNDSDLLWWRWRQPKLRFGCCCATFAFICPFCFAKYGLCGFDYRKKQIQTEKRFRSVMVEMAVIETASENQFPRISTSVVYLLRFPSRNADKQAFLYGILQVMMNCKATHSFTFTADRHPYPDRSASGKDGPHLGSH